MSESESQDSSAAAPTSCASDLIAEFHAPCDTRRKRAQNLARLREDARAAAQREAAAILAAVRADVRRILSRSESCQPNSTSRRRRSARNPGATRQRQ